ncbi:restriction endonuclease subunit S [Hydrogeniiclostridium mannosilyticum]|uniref:Restriction endonuclease subunit S n=1 Tax=Hydrogeniiclostridium mannosilyticum TaxID=2764322 RepID=A0A328U8F2_9FIRM|nr:restriction endonuclease subunit S [Hydrogeniiclostridium mannosilyticum]RAQ22546.1 restriction endonuclease subunit S [Hydrogeniiclostridium mannosilyticum]
MSCEWKACNLGSIMTFKNGKKRPKTVGKFPVYGGNGILGYTNEWNNENCVVIGRVGAYCGSVFREYSKCWISDNAICGISNNDNIEYLYYLLSSLQLNHRHIGTSQPLLTQEILNNIQVTIPPYVVQNKIALILRSLDDKIELNDKINENLERQAFALFDRLMIEAGNSDCLVSEIACLNPKRSLSKNEVARYIDMSQLSTSGAFPSGWKMKPFTGGMRFSNGDTLLARITPCLENGKTAYIDFLDNKEVAFGSTEYIVLAPKEGIPPEYLYCLARYPAFVDYAVKNMNGSSGRQRVSADIIGQFVMPRPSERNLRDFGSVVSALFMKMKNNSLENIRLASLRDSLLPKLMSGEIDVSALQI